MKKISILLILLFSTTLLFSGNDPDKKRINKRLSKIWKLDQIELIKLENHPGTELSGEFFRISGDKKNIGLLYTGRVYTCGANGCNISVQKEATEYFEFFLITDAGGEVLHTEITTYAASHGHEVCSRGWLKQFTGRTGSEKLIYGKDIDAISGATRSGTNLTREVNMVLKKINKNQSYFLSEKID